MTTDTIQPEETMEMLAFFFNQLQMHSPDMGGQHSYRFRSGGWPMTHCKGPNALDAVRAAMQEVHRSREEIANGMLGDFVDG